ncbi:hypothetical protein D3C75_973030 [compost metagenome]
MIKTLRYIQPTGNSIDAIAHNAVEVGPDWEKNSAAAHTVCAGQQQRAGTVVCFRTLRLIPEFERRDRGIIAGARVNLSIRRNTDNAGNRLCSRWCAACCG